VLLFAVFTGVWLAPYPLSAKNSIVADRLVMAYFIALYSVTYFVMHALNFTQTHGAALQNILTAGQMVGQPLWGLALDRGGRTNMTMLCYILCGILTLAIGLPSKSIGVLIFFAVVQGLKGGTIWLASPPIVGSVVGRTSKSPYPSSGWSWPFRHW
jgi:MFS family permease